MENPTWRPTIAFRQKRNGEKELTRDYYAYLKHEIRVTPDERKQWYDLGVHLTNAKERQLECLPDTYAFLTKDTNHR